MMNGKVRAFNGDMGMAMSVFKDMVGKVRFVFADPPYKITQARYDKEGFDYKAMWEVIQKMLCPYGVVAVTCSLTAAVEIMRVAPAGWYRYDLVWHKTTPTGFLNAKKYPLRNHELILIFSPMPLGKHTYNPQKTYGSDNRSPEEKHEEEMRFCKDLNDLRCEMLIDMAKKIEEYLS